MKCYSQSRVLFGCTAGLSLMAFSVSASAVDLNVSGTKANLYGYAELNMIYDVDANLGPFLFPENVSLDNQDVAEGHFQADAYESRLGLSTVTPMEYGGDLKTVIEGDFFGAGGGDLRLRHAYGEWNGILAGQTWTNFPGFTGIYPTVDFRVPLGTANTRQAQLRYTRGHFSVALEESGKLGGSLTDGVAANGKATAAANAKNGLPDLTVRYASRGATSYHASAVLRQLSWDTGTEDDDAFGWGVSFGIAQEVTRALTLRASVVHGDGVGGYMNLNPGAPAYVVNNDVETITATGGTLGASLAFGPGQATLGVAMAKADWDDAVQDGLQGAEGANEMFRSTHLNYIWSPAKQITFGTELAFHERELWNGDSGDALRLQGMAKYSF